MTRFKRVFVFLALALLLTGPALQAIGDGTSAIRGDVVAAAQAWDMINDGALLVDVRSPAEFAGGSIEGAVNIPHTEIEKLAELIGDDRNRPVVFYCRSGGRVGRAMAELKALGYTGIFNATGYEALVATKPECVNC